MHDNFPFIFIATLTLAFGVFSKKSDRFLITGPMFFAIAGIIVSPLFLDIIEINLNTTFVKILAELTLIMVLFIDATELNRYKVTHNKQRIAMRMLLIGLPLIMLLGSAVGYLMFPTMGIIPIILIALILAPTDAALGQAVIKNPKLPLKITQNVSMESGLNDGISLPPIIVCITLLSAEIVGQTEHNWFVFLIMQLTLGPLVGALVGWYGGKMVEKASIKGWMSPTYQRMSALSLAVLSYSLAETVGGNGFIAAFVGGLCLGTIDHETKERIQEFGEAEGQQLTLFNFLLFGLVIVPFSAPYWDYTALAYAMLSLTVIRIFPIFISLINTDLTWEDKLMFGWFGPRGIASVLYTLMFISTVGVEGYEYMLSVIILTVLISIVLHGMSASPIVNWYLKHIKKINDKK